MGCISAAHALQRSSSVSSHTSAFPMAENADRTLSSDRTGFPTWQRREGQTGRAHLYCVDQAGARARQGPRWPRRGRGVWVTGPSADPITSRRFWRWRRGGQGCPLRQSAAWCADSAVWGYSSRPCKVATAGHSRCESHPICRPVTLLSRQLQQLPNPPRNIPVDLKIAHIPDPL